MCRIFSADCFYSGFTASQSPLFCEAKYSGLHFAHKYSVLLRIRFQSFSIHYVLKNILKKHFQLLSDFIFLPPSFYFFAVFVLISPQKDKSSPYLYWKVSISLRGISQKFLPLTIIGKLQAVCRGVSQKFYKKNCRGFFPDNRK